MPIDYSIETLLRKKYFTGLYEREIEEYNKQYFQQSCRLQAKTIRISNNKTSNYGIQNSVLPTKTKLMTYLKRIFNLLILCFVLSSCKSGYFISENYEKENEIKISHFFLRDCETPLFSRNCDKGISDSLFRYFHNQMNSLDLPIHLVDSVKNKMNLMVWKKNKDYWYYKHSRIDTTYIVQSINDNSGTFLIPFINYTDYYDPSPSGVNYSVFVGISIFIIKNNKIIYAMSSRNQSNSIFYVTEKEKAQLMSEIDLQGLWKKTVTEAMQPYLDRLTIN
jgi:hypothetical protein